MRAITYTPPADIERAAEGTVDVTVLPEPWAFRGKPLPDRESAVTNALNQMNPRERDRAAARIDGASELRVLISVVLPLAKPAIAVIQIVPTQTEVNNGAAALVVERVLELPVPGLHNSGRPWQH